MNEAYTTCETIPAPHYLFISGFLLGREGHFMACCEIDTLLAVFVLFILSVFQKY